MCACAAQRGLERLTPISALLRFGAVLVAHTGLGSPRPHLRRDWAHPAPICAGTELAPAHICAGTGLMPACTCTAMASAAPPTSAPRPSPSPPTPAPVLSPRVLCWNRAPPVPNRSWRRRRMSLQRRQIATAHCCAGTGLLLSARLRRDYHICARTDSAAPGPRASGIPPSVLVGFLLACKWDSS